MGDVEIIIKKDLFDSIGVTVSTQDCYIDNKNTIWISGEVSTSEQKLDGYMLSVNANLCDAEGRILYVFREFPVISFEKKPKDFFIIRCVDLTRFLDISMIHHVEVYPRVEK